MAWSDHKFSDQYSNARTVLRDETFPDPFKDAQMSLQRVMGDSGFDASSVKAPSVRPSFRSLRAISRRTGRRTPGNSRTRC